MTYRLGVIGYGDAAGDFIRAARAHPGWTAAAVGGRNLEKAGKLASAYSMSVQTPLEMIRNTGIDCIAVATPPGVHASDAITAAAGGKHLIVEKPLALTPEECTPIIDAAAAGRVQLMCSQSLQFYHGPMEAYRLIAEGAIGKIVSVTIIAGFNYFNAKRSGWQLDPSLSGGGVVMNPVVHFTDLIRYFTGGTVTAVSAITGTRKADYAIEGDASVLMRISGGATGIIMMNGYCAYTDNHCLITGTEGSIRTGFYSRSCLLIKDGAGTEFTAEIPPRRTGTECNDAYYNHLEFMLRTLRDGEPLKSDGKNGRENVRICRAILDSSKKNREVELK